MSTAVWMACILIGGLLAGVACAVAVLAIGPVLDRWCQKKLVE